MGCGTYIGRKEGKMRKLIGVAIIAALVGVLSVPLMVSAATYVQIGITATGSDIDIACNVTDWAVGVVSVNEEAWTTDNTLWGSITNNTSEAVDISVHGHDMTNGGTTWTMSDNGSNGVAIFGMKILKNAGATSNIPRTPSLAWCDELANAGVQKFGLYFKAPSATLGNLLMTMTGDKLYFEATVD